MTDLLTENARLRAALVECEAEIDAYIRQEYPLDHPVHERFRERDFAANPARIALATPTPDAVQEAARVPEIAALIEAAKALHRDMLERAQLKIDTISGEQYRIVNSGRTAWTNFDAALRAIAGDRT